MIILDCDQGSDAWFTARCGIPTASNFDKILTPTGKKSTQAKKYMHQLAGERILGYPEATYTSAAMQDGIDRESEARLLYEMISCEEVSQVGIVYKDEHRAVSCSPDGLICDSHGLEIKCPKLATHTEYLADNKLPTKYIPQVQGSLYVTGLPYWMFLSYYPGMEPLIVRVERDEEYITELSSALDKFCEQLAVLHARLTK